jgi:hypothetical protein
MGNPAKALILKAPKRAESGYQQSYPQNPWTTGKSFKNQALKATIASSHQVLAPTQLPP